MDTKHEKSEYVGKQTQTRDHACHWPGCRRQCPPAMWGCRAHWYLLPIRLRNRVWATYKIGQEVTMTPSPAYLLVMKEVENWAIAYRDGDSAMKRRLKRDDNVTHRNFAKLDPIPQKVEDHCMAYGCTKPKYSSAFCRECYQEYKEDPDAFK